MTVLVSSEGIINLPANPDDTELAELVDSIAGRDVVAAKIVFHPDTSTTEARRISGVLRTLGLPADIELTQHT